MHDQPKKWGGGGGAPAPGAPLLPTPLLSYMYIPPHKHIQLNFTLTVFTRWYQSL